MRGERHARLLAGFDRGRIPERGARTQVSALKPGNTAHDRLRGDLRHRHLRQRRHVHGHRPERVYANRHQLLPLQSGHIRPHSTYTG